MKRIDRTRIHPTARLTSKPDNAAISTGCQQHALGRRHIVGHALVAFLFVVVFLLLNPPEVIVLAHIGLVVWYPATGLGMACMLAISPWYGLLAAFSITLAGTLFYNQPILSWGGTIGAPGVALAFATAAYILQGRLRIDLGLRQQRNVIRYISITTVAAAVILDTRPFIGFSRMRSAFRE